MRVSSKRYCHTNTTPSRNRSFFPRDPQLKANQSSAGVSKQQTNAKVVENTSEYIFLLENLNLTTHNREED